MTRNSPIRAITTRYAGCAFRSRLEARWAVYFDHLDIKWDYEPEGFELGNGLRYLPDFWLPEFQLWVEIKPVTIDAMAGEKARRLAHENHAVLILCGQPHAGAEFCGQLFCWDSKESSAGFSDAIPAGAFADTEDGVGFLVEGGCDNTYYSREFDFEMNTFGPKYPADWGRAEQAATAARSARFEFGEKGGAK